MVLPFKCLPCLAKQYLLYLLTMTENVYIMFNTCCAHAVTSAHQQFFECIMSTHYLEVTRFYYGAVLISVYAYAMIVLNPYCMFNFTMLKHCMYIMASINCKYFLKVEHGS